MPAEVTGEVREGGCFCTRVRFRAELRGLQADVCHCRMCWKWSGGASVAVAVNPEIVMTGENDFSVYVSSPWGERLFCPVCGSSLGWRMRDGSFANLNVGAFDDQEGFILANEIFVDEKPGFYAFANTTRKMTGKEVEDLFSNKDT